MAVEYKRERGRKKINLPGGGHVYIPVLISVSTVDQNGQETKATFENTSQSDKREVHIDQVRHTNPTGSQGSDHIDVERIDSWIGSDAVDRAQESKFLLDNTTGGDLKPPSFGTHQKTHVYRYYQDPNNPSDSGAWVDSELIDEISVVDGNGQENIYFMNNPAVDDLTGQADSNDPDISDTDGGLDPPYRTDPFQNIVNFNDSPSTAFVTVWVYIGIWSDWYFGGDDFNSRLSISNFKYTRPLPWGGLERYFPYNNASLPVGFDHPVSVSRWNDTFYPSPANHPFDWVWVGADDPVQGSNFADFSPSAPGYITMTSGDPLIAQIQADFGSGPSQPL